MVKKIILVLFSISLVILLSKQSYAGFSGNNWFGDTVRFHTNWYGETSFTGTFQHVRDSYDNNQYIKCKSSIVEVIGKYSGYCTAKDAQGIYRYCSVIDNQMIPVIRSITNFSRLRVVYKNGKCTSISVIKSSYNLSRD